MTREEQQLLDDFAKHPAWQLLSKTHKEARDQKLHELAMRIYATPPGEPITDETRLEFLFWRAFFRGQRHMLNNPKLEAKRLAAVRAFEGDDDV